jgi:hypothetical protein
MRKFRLALGVALLALNACGTSLEQGLRPDQSAAGTPDTGPQNKKWQGLIVTDNPYMISSERLEQMNKGGFGGY